MLFTGVGAVGIGGRFITIKPLSETVGIMHVARREVSRFDETIFINMYVGFVAIGTFAISIGTCFDVPICFWVWGRLAVFTFVRRTLLGFNHAGINNADAT